MCRWLRQQGVNRELEGQRPAPARRVTAPEGLGRLAAASSKELVLGAHLAPLEGAAVRGARGRLAVAQGLWAPAMLQVSSIPPWPCSLPFCSSSLPLSSASGQCPPAQMMHP